MTIETWLSFTLAAMMLCISPGPTQLLVMGQSLTYGKRSVVPLILGVLSGDMIAMSLSVLGLGAVLALSATLFAVLKYLGAAYLCYLGIKAWRAKTAKAEDADKTPLASGAIFKEALLVTALNPKGIIFFMAFFPLFIDTAQAYLPQVSVLAISFLLVSGLSVSFYSLFAGQLRQKVQSPKLQTGFNKISGAMLIGAGALTATMQK
ncbi:LysE family translocator [Thalassomonas haliotis]|uniref:LysE family translocator n=1 Tax=Thalassomonas haliotis TaxID=485448 RepID=A0ABY7VD10_9GAMM|nr:LysE family translocator [Thalassomonas haliotis]WDE10793.1 LysE family translocator [Thalassomonas haliotis]